MSIFDDAAPLQFSLRQLLFVVTTIAIGFGALSLPLPKEVSGGLATSAPLFWSGVAVMRIGYWIRSARSNLLKVIGALVMTCGGVVLCSGVLFGFLAIIELTALLRQKLGN